MVTILKTVVNTLNGVEVHGAENLDRLLGSINAIQAVIAQMEKAPTGGTEKNEEVNVNG